jgi:hypothetical protein
MAELRQEIANFLALTADTDPAWRSIEVRTVAFLFNGEYHNVITRLQLLDVAAPPAAEVETLARTTSLLAFRATVGCHALSEILDRISSGYLEIGFEKVSCLKGVTSNAITPYTYAYTRAAGLAGDAPSDPIGRSHLLRMTGDNPQFAIQQFAAGTEGVDAELRAADVPWDGLDGLTEHLFGPQFAFDANNPARIEVFAPLAARLDTERCSLRGGSLTVELILANARLSDYCSVGFATLKEHGALGGRSSKRINKTDWTADGEMLRATMTFAVDADVARGSVFLRVGGRHVIDRATVRDSSRRTPNTRLLAYAAFDGDLVLFRQWLFEAQGSDSVQFERAIGRLFTFAGFFVDQFPGDKRFSDAVDVLAHSPLQDVLLAIECTTGQLQSAAGKPGKLVGRAADLEAAMPAGQRLEVIPVLVTSLVAKSLAPADVENAATNRIVVLTREDLLALVDLVQEQPNSAAALDFIRARIPSAHPIRDEF